MKKIRWLIVLCICFALLAPYGYAGEIERIQAKGEIVVSLNKGYPPFAMVRDNKPFGLDVDIAHILAEYLGVKVRFIQPDTYDQQIPKLLAGESDIIIAAMTRTVKRGLTVSFTDPYFEVSQAALVRRDREPVGATSYFDLLEIPDLKLGVKSNTTHEKFARELFPEKAIKTYPTAEAAADAVLKGEVDAMAADSPFVQIWRDTHLEEYVTVGALLAPVTKEYYAFAVRQGDSIFLEWLNLFIDQIKIDGTLDLLKYEYFGRRAWSEATVDGKEKMTRAQLLKNRFVKQKQAMIEKRRKEAMTTKPEYD